MIIRLFEERDREAVCEITLAVFEPVSIDAAIERRFGHLKDTSWQDRKRQDINADLDENSGGCFVAEIDGQVAGFVTTAISQEIGVGRIPNLGVSVQYQGHGVGKTLVSHALDYFEDLGLQYSQIETTTSNEKGMRFYPGVGYEEVARKIYYFMELSGRKDR